MEDIIITEVKDKAVSVGEKSIVSASNLFIEKSGIGLASKDSSSVTLDASHFSKIYRAALMAYIKKQEYGPSRIIATNISFEDDSMRAKVQPSNQIQLNGKEIISEEIDIKGLYSEKNVELHNWKTLSPKMFEMK